MKNKNTVLIYSILLVGLVLTLANSCKNTNEAETPSPSDIVTDIDGNIYHTVTIGTQTWMVENLKTTKYRNGDAIDSPTGSWVFNTGAQSIYNNVASNSTTYGRLYNWYAATDSRNIAPIGWHVPTDAEWTTLIIYLGGETIAGGKLKEIGTMHWSIPNTSATNETGFTALPGGYRDFDLDENSRFTGAGEYGIWWSSTEANVNLRAWNRELRYNNSNVVRDNFGKAFGVSIRCIKDY